jgi:hypothetical protein
VLKVLKTNSHPGKKPVLHPACKITNLCPLLRGIFRASEGLGGVRNHSLKVSKYKLWKTLQK